MLSIRRHAARKGAATAAAALTFGLLAGCGGQGGSPSTSTSAPAPSSGSTSASAQSQADRIELQVRGGAVVGGVQTFPVKLGRTVDLVVSSDVADEVHLHGYNKKVVIPAGGRATLNFVADVPGVFEVELEKSGVQLAKLQVR